MAGNVINRYLWLINLLRTGNGKTYKEISKKWEDSIYNDKPGEGLPAKTFRNHCGVISEIFGVEIKCDRRNQYRYYIPEPNESDKWKLEMLNYILLHSAIRDNHYMAERVKNFDEQTSKDLPTIIDCIQRKAVISFIKPGSVKIMGTVYLADFLRARMANGTTYSDFLVLATVQVNYQWYAIGAFVEPDKPLKKWKFAAFNFCHMCNISVQYESKVETEKDFSLQEYLDSFVYDQSNPFGDDSLYLERDLRNRKTRLKYGTIFTSMRKK